MKYFLSSEIIEKTNIIELISIGIKCEDGRKYYALSSSYNYYNANQITINDTIEPIFDELMKKNQVGKYKINSFHRVFGKSNSEMRNDILEFLGYREFKNGEPEIWGYLCARDWIVFSQVLEMPNKTYIGIPDFCNDLRQTIENIQGTGCNTIVEIKGKTHNSIDNAERVEKLFNDIAKLY